MGAQEIEALLSDGSFLAFTGLFLALSSLVLVAALRIGRRVAADDRAFLQKWCKKNEVELIGYSERMFRTPFQFFILFRGRGQRVFKLHVRDREGGVFDVWLKVGSYMSAFRRDKVVALWPLHSLRRGHG